MKSDMLLAVMQLAAERDLPQEAVVSAFEDAVAAAYRKESEAQGYDVLAKLDPETGDVTINTILHVVDYIEEDEYSKGQIIVDDAKEIKSGAELGDIIVTGELEFKPQRIAARTVTQVLMQRLRNAERHLVFEQFADKEGEIISASIRRVEPSRSDQEQEQRPKVIVDLGKADAYLPPEEQCSNERYRAGMELRFYVLKVAENGYDSEGAPEIVLSRTHPNLLRRLIESEVPEVKTGIVEVKSIARDPGSRSKVAVYSNKQDIDPIGACVGLRGIRIQNIVTELMGEKIDILEWSENPAIFISNALGPAQVENVIMLADGSAEVIVPDGQLSLAIGREGQNVSLATKLTDCNIDIKGASKYADEQLALQREIEAAAAAEAEAKAEAERKRLEEEELARIAAQADATEDAADDEVLDGIAVPAADTDSGQRDAVDSAETVETDQIDSTATDTVPSIFVPEAPIQPADAPDIAEDEFEDEEEAEPELEQESPDQEDLDLELLELEEKIRELELEEAERKEAERQAAELEALEQDIDSDEIWTLPSELGAGQDTQDAGVIFAEDIPGYGDPDQSSRSSRRGGNTGGQRRSSR